MKLIPIPDEVGGTEAENRTQVEKQEQADGKDEKQPLLPQKASSFDRFSSKTDLEANDCEFIFFSSIGFPESTTQPISKFSDTSSVNNRPTRGRGWSAVRARVLPRIRVVQALRRQRALSFAISFSRTSSVIEVDP